MLHTAIEDYLSLKRSLGAVFATETRILHAFGRTLGDMPLDAIGPQACRGFCRGTGRPTRWWERKHQALQSFFAFLVSRHALAASPCRNRLQSSRVTSSHTSTPTTSSPACSTRLPFCAPRVHRPRPHRPHLAAGAVRRRAAPWRGPAIAVLRRRSRRAHPGYLGHQVLQVPPGADRRQSRRCSGTYRTARRHLPMPVGSRSTFSLPGPARRSRWPGWRQHSSDCAITPNPPSGAESLAATPARSASRLRRAPADRLVSNGRRSAACLPLLATYLGHINLSGTQAYLTMTPELLAAAAQRFERYADIGPEGCSDV